MAHQDFLLPDLGEGLTEAEIVRWLVAVGDHVEVDQPLVEVETAKANVEVPSPFGGVVVALRGEPGDEVPVGAALVTIDVSAAAPAADGTPSSGHPAVSAEERPLVGLGERAGRSRRRRRRAAARSEQGDRREETAGEVEARDRPRATPPVRKLARDLGIDLTVVHGTGHDGVITRKDVETAAQGGETATTQAAPPASLSAVPEGVRIPVRGVRKAIAEKMRTSRREIPDAISWVDADATELLALRDAMNAKQSDVHVTPLALILRACVAGLQVYRELNARWDGEAHEIELIGPVHLGFAAQTDRGLVVPVIENAHTLSTLALAAELERLASAARFGVLAPADLTGSTFTVSNYGSFGVDGGPAIINYPEAAILGVGRIIDRPWVHDSGIAIRKVTQLSLSFDHRICDGAIAGGFLRFIADCVESPATLLGAL